jgi:glutaredoxin
LFDAKGLTYREINFDNEPDVRNEVVSETGHRTVPVIIDNRGDNPMFIGGFDETNRYLRS